MSGNDPINGDSENVQVETVQKENIHEGTGMQIPDEIADLLHDIRPDAPTGENPESSDDQDTMVAYMTVETEMSKLGDNDYGLCVKNIQQLLREKSKHLRLAVWLLIAWYRTENVNGFKKGLLLILELLRKYKDSLHPENAKQRSKIIQSLASEGRIKTMEKTGLTSDNAGEFEEIGLIFAQLVDETQKQFADNPPKLTALEQIIRSKQAEAQKMKESPQKQQEEASSQRRSESAPDRKPAARQSTASAPAATTSPTAGAVQTTPTALTIQRENDAVVVLKRSLLFYFEDHTNGTANRKVPADASIYAMSRILRWSKLIMPPNKNNVTQIEPPNQLKQAFIDKLVGGKDYNALIPEIEINFINRDEFLYWLDAQRYVIEALENRGSDTADAAAEIKIQLSRLLNRMPDLPKLMFADNKTPFASSETRDWIGEEVQGVFGGGKQQEKILPPIFGEEYEDINTKYEAISAELPANFDSNVKELQKMIAADSRPKGKFLRMLSLANYCHAAKQYKVAAVLFNELIELIDTYNIRDWERALCVSVWQSMYLNNDKLLKSDLPKEHIDELEKKQSELFDLIGKYDCLRALKITNQLQ
jgi:type VI secretion system protein VasJ